MPFRCDCQNSDKDICAKIHEKILNYYQEIEKFIQNCPKIFTYTTQHNLFSLKTIR